MRRLGGAAWGLVIAAEWVAIAAVIALVIYAIAGSARPTGAFPWF